MVRYTGFQGNTEYCIEPGGCLFIFQGEDICLTGFGTGIAEGTPVLPERQCRRTVLFYKNDLFITGSDTTFAFAGRTLTLKKRFFFAVWRPYRKRKILSGLTQWFTERFKEIPSACHY